MKPLFSIVVTILVLSANAHPENIEDVKELPQNKEPVVEAEESEPQARLERCTNCPGPKLNFKSHKDVLAALTQLPAGTEVHTQQSFEGCSSDKGCAGLKVKDGQVLERFGNLDDFRQAAAQNTGGEFTFHAAGTLGNNLLEGGLNGEAPFWWMNQNSPFKNTGAGGNFEKFSKSSSSSFSTTGNAAGGGANFDLAGNPFLNGDFSKLGSGFTSGGASFTGAGASGAEAKPSTYQSSSFESSSFSTSNKDGKAGFGTGLNNAGLNNAGFQAQGSFGSNQFAGNSASQFGAGQSNSASQFGAGQSNSANQFGAGQSNSGNQFGQSGTQFGAGQSTTSRFGQASTTSQFGAGQGQFGQGQLGSGSGQNFNEQFGSSTNKFSATGAGFTGSSPSPFTASTGSNVNLVQNTQKASEFDFTQQQQTQQNIDEAFRHTGNVNAHEHSGGDLQQTCAGQGYVCVHKAQCNNGVVNTNGGNLLQANTQKQYCNVRTEICCRIEVSSLAGAGNLQGSLGVGSGTFSGSNSQGSGLFVSQTGQSSQSGQSSLSGQSSQSAQSGQSGQSGFGQTGQGFNQNGQRQNGQGFQSGAGFGSFNKATTSSFGTQGSFGAGQNAFGSNAGANRGVTQESSSSSFEANRGNKYGGFGSTVAPTTNRYNGNSGNFNNEVYKSTSQSNFIETDSFSAGSENTGIYRPGSGPGLKPGIPYLPPVDSSTSNSNQVSSTAFVTTQRPFTTPRPTRPPPTKPVYVPSTSAPGYLPPQGESSNNKETRLPSPRPTYSEGEIILDESRQPTFRPPTYTPGPQNDNFPAGCAAALKCTPIEFCTAEGVISTSSVFLTRDQEAYRVPLTDCKDIGSGRVGKCCRDPDYTDPWPSTQLGKWVPGVFGGNDGKYAPDSRGSPTNNVRPQVTLRPPVTGSVILNNFIQPKPTTPSYATKGQGQYGVAGQGQATQFGQGSQFSQTTSSFGQGTKGQGFNQGQGSYSQGGRGQIDIQGQAGQNQYTQTQGISQSQGSSVTKGSGISGSQGAGFGISQGAGIGISKGQGQYSVNGQGVGVTQGVGQTVSQTQGQFSNQGAGFGISQGQGVGSSQGAGFGVTQGQGQATSQSAGFGIRQGQGVATSQGAGFGVTQGQGQGVSQGAGFGIRQGQGVATSQGAGFGVTQGQGQATSQSAGFGIRQGQGVATSQGAGFGVTQGQGQGVSQGAGFGIRQGQGLATSQGAGFGVTQGQGQAVSQGAGFGIRQGQGVAASQGAGFGVSQGQGQAGTQGAGFGVNVGQGQAGFGFGVSQGSGQRTTQGTGFGISQGQGQGVSQGFGFGVNQGLGFGLVTGQGQKLVQGAAVENDYSESVQRVFLQQYSAGGQCGLLNPQKPYGNRNDLEADFGEVSWQAMVLLQTNKSLLCGGVITRPDVVITSAACVDGLEAKNVLIKGGEWKLGIDDEPLPFQIVQVKNILRHPYYRRGSLKYDAAILVLSENLRFAKNIYPICLPGSKDTLDAYYNGAGECIVTGWGKTVLQVHLQGSIIHSLNVSLINPGECQAKLSQDYPHLLEQYDQDSCVCGQPTNPANNICKVDVGSALACTTGDGHYVLRGIYSWDSGCQIGNQLAGFYKFDLEWYEWAIGLIESARFAQFTTGSKITKNTYSSQINSGIKTSQNIKGGQTNGIKDADLNQFGFSQFGSSKYTEGSNSGVNFGTELKGPLTNTFSATYTEKKVFQTEPKIVTYTTKPEIVTFTTKPEYFTYTTKPKLVTYTTKPEIVTYTTKPKIISYTTKPQIIRYETSGSGTVPQYVAPEVSFNPSLSEVAGHKHSPTCKCEGK